MIYETELDYEETRHGELITIYMPEKLKDMWESGKLLYNATFVLGDGGDWDFWVDNECHFAPRADVEASGDFEEIFDGYFENEESGFALVDPSNSGFSNPEPCESKNGWWQMTTTNGDVDEDEMFDESEFDF